MSEHGVVGVVAGQRRRIGSLRADRSPVLLTLLLVLISSAPRRLSFPAPALSRARSRRPVRCRRRVTVKHKRGAVAALPLLMLPAGPRPEVPLRRWVVGL